MSETEPEPEDGPEEAEEAEEPEEPPEEPDSTESDSVVETDEGTPDVSDDQQADTPNGLADVDPADIEDSAGSSDGESEESEESGDSGGSDYDGDTGEWGDMVVGICTTTTNTVIEKHGDGHKVEEDHFKGLNIDKYANQVMQKYADSEEMEPEKALLIGMALGIGGPVAMHTDLVGQLANEVKA